MNRMGLGLAVGAGYVLGRTRKLKLAFAVGTLVAGKRMRLSPRALADLVSGQLRNNPQFKELGDQLRQDLRGVGGAATGALVERRLDALADRLHDRTAGLRERLSGGVPEGRGLGNEEHEDNEEYDENEEYGEYEDEGPDAEAPPEAAREKAAPKQLPAKKAEAEKATQKKAAAKKATAKKAAKKAPARKAAPAKKAAAAKRTAGRKTASARAAARNAKGGGER